MRSTDQWNPRGVHPNSAPTETNGLGKKECRARPAQTWFLTTLANTETPCKNMMVSTIGSSSSLSSSSTVAINDGHQLRIKRELVKPACFFAA